MTAADSIIPKQLLWLLLCGAILRASVLSWTAHLPLQIDDEQSYDAIATQLATTGNFAISSDELTSLRPPLYPAIVSISYSLFGVGNYLPIRLLQAGLGLALSVVVYLLARSMFSPQTGLWAAGFCCFYPTLLCFESLLLTEIAFALLATSACLMLQYYWKSESLVYLAMFGFLLGFSALTRSILWLFPPFVFLFLIFACTGSFQKRLTAALIPCLAFGLVITPWTIRNSRLHQTFVTIDVMGGRNLMMGNYEHTPLFRAWDAISITGDKAWFRILANEYPEFAKSTQGQKDKIAMRRGLKFIAAHPALTAQRTLIKFCNVWQLDRTIPAGLSRGYWGNMPKPIVVLLSAIIVGSYALAATLGVLGLAMTRPTDIRMHWFLLILLGFVCTLHSIVFGHSRYLLPFLPLILIYAAAAWVNLRGIWQQRYTLRFVFATSLVAILITSWAWEIVFVELARYRTQLLS